MSYPRSIYTDSESIQASLFMESKVFQYLRSLENQNCSIYNQFMFALHTEMQLFSGEEYTKESKN